jgi:hypothetical protein
MGLAAHFWVAGFAWWLRFMAAVEPHRQNFPVWMLGSFERFFAFTLVFYHVKETGVLLVAWMAANSLPIGTGNLITQNSITKHNENFVLDHSSRYLRERFHWPLAFNCSSCEIHLLLGF